MSNVFISYSHTDNESADAIVAILEELGIPSFRDVKDINWGDSITPTVREGLEKSGALIVIISLGSLKSGWVHFEVGYAMALQKRVLPFLTHPALDLPGYIKDLLHVQSPEEIRKFFLSNPDWAASTSETVIEASSTALFDRAVEMMPDLLAKMKDDLSKPENKFIREFVPLKSDSYGFQHDKPRFEYYGNDDPHLQNKVDLLEEVGFVHAVTFGDYPTIYRMTEEFVDALLRWEIS